MQPYVADESGKDPLLLTYTTVLSLITSTEYVRALVVAGESR